MIAVHLNRPLVARHDKILLLFCELTARHCAASAGLYAALGGVVAHLNRLPSPRGHWLGVQHLPLQRPPPPECSRLRIMPRHISNHSFLGAFGEFWLVRVVLSTAGSAECFKCTFLETMRTFAMLLQHIIHSSNQFQSPIKGSVGPL